MLDVGSGSGYLTAVLHHLVGPMGKVVGIDHIPELVEWSVDNLKKDGLGDQVASGSIVDVDSTSSLWMAQFKVELGACVSFSPPATRP